MKDRTTSSCPMACPRPREVTTNGRYPLLALQQAMVAGELSPDRWQRDLVQIQCDLNEAIDVERLHTCFEQLVRRHESLRAHLEWDAAGVGSQWVGDSSQPQFDVISALGMDAGAAQGLVAQALQAAWTQPFDVTHPPRLRALLVQWEPARFQLFVTYQETELDEHSGKVLIRELLELYDRGGALLPPATSFRAYLDWLSAHRDAEACHFWGDLLDQAPAPTPPPMLGAEQCDEALTFCLGQLNRVLSEPCTARLKQRALEHGSDLNAVLLTAWAIVIAAHAGEEDVRFAAVFSLRDPAYATTQSAVAMCFSVLPFVVRGARSRSANDLLAAVSASARQARRHIAMLDGSAATRRLLGHPSTQSLVFFDEADVDAVLHAAHPEWTHRRFTLYGRNPYAIALRGFGGRQLRIQSWYNPQSYSHRVVECLLDQVVEVLERLAAETEAPIATAGLLPAGHAERLRQWEAGEQRPYRASTLYQLVEEQVRRAPESVALVDQDQALTYQELSIRSNQFAHLLIQAGLRPGAAVALCTRRSAQTIVALLGILKAGGAYVPVDASWPAHRAASALRRLGCPMVVTDTARVALLTAALAELPEPMSVIQLDGDRPGDLPGPTAWFGPAHWTREPTSPPPSTGTPDDLAYVIFTSGSTGTPKGVAVRHRPVCNLIDWAQRSFALGPSDRVLWVTSLGFDLSVFDIFGILACGGSIRVASEADLQSPERLIEILAREPITFWNSAPQALERLRHFLDTRHLPEDADLSRLRLVFLSGDWIPLSLPDAIRRTFTQAQVISLGGATEATVWSNSFAVGAIQRGWRSIPYGRPIQNARYYVLDAQQRRCGVGVTGELFIGGEVLASGYAADTEQTADRFVPDPYSSEPSARMYRTGDLARWWPDGNMELLGRLDHQVKVRGYRIELGEIEHALRSHPDVHDAVAIARRNEIGENQLTAYLQGRSDAAISYSSLRSHLQQLLPEYMIPAQFVPVSALPLTSNGKVDRRALLSLPTGPALRERPHVAPRTPAESRLARVFSQALGGQTVGATDSFFELGGDSLSALGVIFAAEQAGLHLTMDMLRKHPIEMLATAAAAPCPAAKGCASAEGGPVPLTPNQLWLLDRSFANPAAYAFSTWLQSPGPMDLEALSLAWRAVVDQHAALRMRFQQTSHGMTQSVSPAGTEIPVQTADLRSCPQEKLQRTLQSHAAALARGAKLIGEALPQLLCARVADGQDLLFLFIPHIITDEYSARIIIEDLGNAYLAAKSRSPLQLPAPTLPFAQWAAHLQSCAARPELDQQVERFCRLAWDRYRPLPRDVAEGTNTYAQAQDLRVMLARPETQQLLDASRQMRLPAASFVTAAVVQSVAAWSGHQAVLLDFTGAGREPVFGSAALHRSVGYFTTIHPVLFQLQGDLPGAQAMRQIHQGLQAAPLPGSLYGLVRYLHPEAAIRGRLAALPQAEIKLNYHGQQPLCGDACPFQTARFGVPHTLAPTDQRRYLLNLEVGYRDGCLVTACKYPQAMYRRSTMQQFLEGYLDRLRRGIGAASRDSASELRV